MKQSPASQAPLRDHGGGLDAAAMHYGGARADWIDLSTGINPVAYDTSGLSQGAWTALPDARASAALLTAARVFWAVPDKAAILAAPGASILIAHIPGLWSAARVRIDTPTYNEHAAAFSAHGWQVGADEAQARVIVHPNNPTGHWSCDSDLTTPCMVIDESFCDVAPERSLILAATRPHTVILKSFGKFWGLAGLRLGFAIGDPALIERLREALGPWPVSGPALEIGARALRDHSWAQTTRKRLVQDAERLDRLMAPHATLTGGTDLFRLYDTDDAARLQSRLATHHIWTRIFPYSDRLIRLGLPAPDQWTRLEAAL